MSDVIWAAIIAVAGSGITGTIAFKGAIASAKESTKRELARLRDEHREADRRVRRDAYVAVLNSWEELDLLTSRFTPEPTRDDFDGWLRGFRASGVGAQVVESEDVKAARKRMGKLVDKLAAETVRRLDAGQEMDDALGQPYVAMRAELNEAGNALNDAMRRDLAFVAD
jgi:hypothetical protein